MRSNAEMVLGLRDFYEQVKKWINGFECIHGENGFGERNVDEEKLLEFCGEKKNYV